MLPRPAPALALLASVAVAQISSVSVVTSISIPPAATTEGVFTIQTSVPIFAESSACPACFMEPCPPCGPVSEGSVGILPGETRIGSGTPVPSGSMGILPGETPTPSSLLSSTPASAVPRTSASTLRSTSAAVSAPPQQSTAAASPLRVQGDQSPLKLALAASGLALVGASLVFL